MDKSYIYQGMIVLCNGNPSLVMQKNDSTVTIMNMQDGDLAEVTYDDLFQTKDYPVFQQYNRSIREKQSRYSSKLVKNNDSFIFQDGSKVWFTSDTHFGHERVIRFCNRPWDTIEEMNRGLIENWNSCVQPDDTVFHLGDFCWGGSSEWTSILSQLNGHIHLILGNHDIKNIRQGYMKYFESVSFQSQILVEDQSIYLNHYPFLTYGGIYRDQPVWQLFGHIHSKQGKSGKDTMRAKHLLETQYDVGVDNNNYKPVNFNQVKEIITSQISQDYD